MLAHSTQAMLLTGTHPRGNPWTAFTVTPERPRPHPVCESCLHDYIRRIAAAGADDRTAGWPVHGLPVAAHGFGFLIGVKEGRMVSWAEADVLAHYSDQGVWYTTLLGLGRAAHNADSVGSHRSRRQRSQSQPWAFDALR